MPGNHTRFPLGFPISCHMVELPLIFLNIPVPVSLEPWFSKQRRRPATPASPGNALVIQILVPTPGLLKQRLGSSNLCGNQPYKGFWRSIGWEPLAQKVGAHEKHPQSKRESSLTAITHQIIPSNRLWITRCDWVTTISNVTWVQPNCNRRKRISAPWKATASTM